MDHPTARYDATFNNEYNKKSGYTIHTSTFAKPQKVQGIPRLKQN